ncbi:hypothetical protein RUM43_005961 [Polyplax serrata]|uniref:Uncharacterized protein n=1 Tax=Polyplax serrata TaxID=468196 RepID=A0AAN8S559_POLSC
MFNLLALCLVACSSVFWRSSEAGIFNANLDKTDTSLIVTCDPKHTTVWGYTFKATEVDNVKLKREFLVEYDTGVGEINACDKKEVEKWVESLAKKLKPRLKKKYWPRTTLTFVASYFESCLPKDFESKMLPVAIAHAKTLGFTVTNSQSVLRIDSKNKFGLTWFGLNLLLGTLQNPAAAVGITKHRTGVAFSCKDGKPTDSDVYGINAKNMHFSLYLQSTSSGIDDVRKTVLKLSKSLGGNNLETYCIKSTTKSKWEYKNQEYTVRGVGDNKATVDYAACENEVRQIISKLPPSRPLCGQKVYALAEMYTTAFFIDAVNKEVLNATVKEIGAKAKEFCETRETMDPFTCMDAAYMHVLLKEHYKLGDSDTIQFRNTIKGINVHWHLGVAYIKRFTNVK